MQTLKLWFGFQEKEGFHMKRIIWDGWIGRWTRFSNETFPHCHCPALITGLRVGWVSDITIKRLFLDRNLSIRFIEPFLNYAFDRISKSACSLWSPLSCQAAHWNPAGMSRLMAGLRTRVCLVLWVWVWLLNSYCLVVSPSLSVSFPSLSL